MFTDVSADRVLKLGHRGEGSTANTLTSEDGEEIFDGIEPGPGCWREMDDPAGVISQPLSNLGMLMGGVVIGDGVDDLASRNGSLDGVEELDELLMGMFGHTAPDDGTIEDVQCGEEGCGAMSFIVVGHCSAFSRLERQAGLRSVERLDLAFFVNGDNNRMRGRVHIKTDDVLDLRSEGRIVGLLEGPQTMRLETAGPPEGLHGGQANADRFGDGTTRPMSLLAGRFAAGQRQNSGHRFRRQRRFAGFARLVAQKALDSLLGKSLLPAPHRRASGTAAPGHFKYRKTLRRMKDDMSPLNVFLRAVPVANDGGQTHAIRGGKQNADGLGHAKNIAQSQAFVNLLFCSVH